MEKKEKNQIDLGNLFLNHQLWTSGDGNRCGPHFDFLKIALMPSVSFRPSWGSNKNQFLTI